MIFLTPMYTLLPFGYPGAPPPPSWAIPLYALCFFLAIFGATLTWWLRRRKLRKGEDKWRKELKEELDASPESQVTCPACGMVNTGDVPACRQCGRQLAKVSDLLPEAALGAGAAAVTMAPFGETSQPRVDQCGLAQPETTQVPTAAAECRFTMAAQQRSKRPTVTCPKCAAIVAEGIQACPACGTKLAPQSQSQQLMQEAAAKLCPACGAAVIAGTAACGACGTPAQPTRPAAQQQVGKRRLGVLLRDVMVNGAIAFRKDEVVTIEKESPDPARPAYKYVVLSDLLSQRFRLSEDELQV